MSRAELFKIRTHRTPWVCAGLLLVGVLASPAVLLFYTPSSSSAYADAFTRTYSVLAPLIVREIHFRLLQADHGGMLRQLLRRDSPASRVWKLAENRMHAARGYLAFALGELA